MKTKLTTFTLLLAALGGLFVSPLAATPGRMQQVGRVLVPNRSEDITEGSSVNFVRQMIGGAHEQITPNLWLYHNFQPVRGEAGENDCRELVIHFVNERVASIYLADDEARTVMIDRITRGAPELVALATEPDTTAPGTQVAMK